MHRWADRQSLLCEWTLEEGKRVTRRKKRKKRALARNRPGTELRMDRKPDKLDNDHIRTRTER